MGELIAYKQHRDDAGKGANWFSSTQISDVIKEQDELARKQVSEGLAAIYADHARRSLIRTGATLRAGLELFEQQANDLADNLVQMVSSLSLYAGSFGLIMQAFEEFLAYLDEELETIVEKVQFEIQDSQQLLGFSHSAKIHWTERRARLLAALEQRRSAFIASPDEVRFVELASLDLAIEDAGLAGDDHPAVPPPSGAAAIPARLWHEMWAHLAVELYTGKLKLTSRSQVEQVMADWLSAKGLDAAGAEHEECARQLWTKYVSIQSITSHIESSFWDSLKASGAEGFAWRGGGQSCDDGSGAFARGSETGEPSITFMPQTNNADGTGLPDCISGHGHDNIAITAPVVEMN